MAFVGGTGTVKLGRNHFVSVRSNLCTFPNTKLPLQRRYCSTVRICEIVASGATQQETPWNPVKVLENTVHCEAHRYLVVNAGVTSSKGSLIDSYRYPGQYVQLRRDSSTKAAFLAVSNAPNIQGIFEFLIKDSDSLEWIQGVKAGESVEMSPIGGKGFPISPTLDLMGYPAIPEERVPRDILLFATGSGIAPIRACIESFLNGLNIAKRREVKLYYGARYLERMAYKDRFSLWEEDGVKVIPVLSQPKERDEWGGATGYVQDVLRKEGIAQPKQTGAVLCGLKEMTQEVGQILTEAGVEKERILLNF